MTDQHILRRKRIESPMHAQPHPRHGVLNHRFPTTLERPWDLGPHETQLVFDLLRGVRYIIQVATDPVHLIRDPGEVDVVGAVDVEGQFVACAVEEADGLEEGAAEGGVAARVAVVLSEEVSRCWSPSD